MNLIKWFSLCLFILISTLSLHSQITTSTIRGVITDDTGEPLPGAAVVAIHIPTGTEYGTATMVDGQYVIANLKAGGPYEVVSSYISYEEVREQEIYAPLAATVTVDLSLQNANLDLETIEVIYDKNDLFQGNQKGTSTNVGQKQLERLPSLNRSLQDVTRLSPQGGVNSFAGSNYRFNNLSIDGASNNDVLGFQEPSSGAGGSVASGTPGGLAQTQPISLDAVQEVQISVAPFDVRQGNFTGANVNAVTRSGTNKLEGSVYGFGRNQNLVGKSVDASRSPVDDFYDYQFGARLGMPIVKNKLFAFANYERSRRSTPVLAVPGTPASNIPLEVVQGIVDTLAARLNYDPGTFGATNIFRNSDKFFVRFDYNISSNHQLAVRHNLIKAAGDNLERSESVFKFGSQQFTHNSVTNSTVIELKSRVNNNISNNLIVGFNNIEDNRNYDGRVFPHVEIKYNTANNIFLGTYREASIYGATINSFQLRDNLSIYKNNHTITLGTSNEIYDFEYRFLTAWNGRWEYKSLEDFYAEKPNRVRGVYRYEDNSFEFNRSNPSADYRVMLLGVYAQDEYRASDRLNITAGLRVDMQILPDDFPISDKLLATPELAPFATTSVNSTPQLNPRVGFNYAFNEEKTSQLRGGVGIFSGRIPFVWYGYTHYISGVNYGNVDLKPGGEVLPLEEDVSQLQNLQPGLTEINLVDKDFKLPRVLRGSLAYDVQLPQRWSLTLEGLYSNSLQSILFQSLNVRDEKTSYDGADNREYFSAPKSESKINDDFTNVFYLTNTQQGYQYSLTASVRKEVADFLNLSFAYTYGESKDVVNGVRNSMSANWSVNQAIDANNPTLAYSNFDLRHRIISYADFQQKWDAKNLTYASLIFSAQSGSPFSFTYSGDVNSDGSSRNDLVYVPANVSEINFIDITDASGTVVTSAAEQWNQLSNYIDNSEYLSEQRGEYVERNGGRTPWNTRIDLRVAHRLFTGDAQFVEFTFDLFNVMNLISHKWGWQYYVPNVSNASYQLLEYEGRANNEPLYQFKNPSGTPWQVDALNSRWQGQMGLRFIF